MSEHRGQTIFVIAAVATILGAIAAIAIVPEVRRFFRLEENVALERPKNDTTDQATRGRAGTKNSSAACVSNPATVTMYFQFSMDGLTWSPMRLRSGYDACIGDGRPVQVRVVTAGRENLAISYLLIPGQRYQFVLDPVDQTWEVEGTVAR